jgi:hypothetical protein
MPIAVDCECGESYLLKDEFGGKTLTCPRCDGRFAVPKSTGVVEIDPVFQRDKFLIRQKRLSLSPKYFIGEEGGRELLFVRRPSAWVRRLLAPLAAAAWIGLCVSGTILFGMMNDYSWTFTWIVGGLVALAGLPVIAIRVPPKRHLTFYRDPSMSERLLTVRQDFKFVGFVFRFTLLDAKNWPVAVFRKNNLYDLLRKRWHVDDPNGRPICVAMEDSMWLSILRRFLGSLFGLLRTNFIITTPYFGDVLGEFNRKFTLFDRYVLNLERDPDRALDRRVALALGVLLDTAEKR